MKYNKYYKWEDLVKQYPDMWVFYDVNKSKKKNGVLDKVFVLGICRFSERTVTIMKLDNLGIDFDCARTTFSAPTVGALS